MKKFRKKSVIKRGMSLHASKVLTKSDNLLYRNRRVCSWKNGRARWDLALSSTLRNPLHLRPWSTPKASEENHLLNDSVMCLRQVGSQERRTCGLLFSTMWFCNANELEQHVYPWWLPLIPGPLRCQNFRAKRSMPLLVVVVQRQNLATYINS